MLSFERAILISDLHLCDTRPATNRAFFDFLEKIEGHTEALFILGDFFEYWVGDDAASSFHLEVAEHLYRLSAICKIYLMVGNRDFSLGRHYAERCGAVLLDDPSLVELGGEQWLLSHGDVLCTDDLAYQRFRRIIRHPLVLGTLRRLPRRWRILLAERLRDNSRQRFKGGGYRYIDVNTDAVVKEMDRYRVKGIIHGHTHMADWHEHRLLNGGTGVRLVLGDWHDYGWLIRFEDNDKTLERFRIT